MIVFPKSIRKYFVNCLGVDTMPCLIVKTSQTINNAEKNNICLSLSKLTAELLAKPENYVMILFDDKTTMSMSGTTEPSAYIELKSINLAENQTSLLSEKICQQLSETLKIPAKRIYIEFTNAQRHLWGWDKKTF